MFLMNQKSRQPRITVSAKTNVVLKLNTPMKIKIKKMMALNAIRRMQISGFDVLVKRPRLLSSINTFKCNF